MGNSKGLNESFFLTNGQFFSIYQSKGKNGQKKNE